MGVREAWLTDLYRRHGDAVYAYAARRLASPEDAEDVVVDVFATAWRRREQVPDPALPWLYATAANMVAHVARGEARRGRLGARLSVIRSVAPDDAADRIAEAMTARQVVARAMQALPEADAEVLRLWAWEHLEAGDIAQVLDCSPGAARTRLHRARARLREALQDPAAGSEER